MTLEDMEQAIRLITVDDTVQLKPTQMFVSAGLYKTALKIMFPHHVLKRRKGVRGRALTLKWRRK